MVEIKEISYKDERLGFFADQRKLVQKRYDRLEKQIKPDEPYTSERREFLSDLGRELSFYNDVVEMLEHGVVPKSEIERLESEKDALIKNYAECMKDYAREIFEEIWASIASHAYTSKSEDYADGAYDTIEWVDSKIAEIEKKYVTE